MGVLGGPLSDIVSYDVVTGVTVASVIFNIRTFRFNYIVKPINLKHMIVEYCFKLRHLRIMTMFDICNIDALTIHTYCINIKVSVKGFKLKHSPLHTMLKCSVDWCPECVWQYSVPVIFTTLILDIIFGENDGTEDRDADLEQST